MNSRMGSYFVFHRESPMMEFLYQGKVGTFPESLSAVILKEHLILWVTHNSCRGS